MRGVLRLPAFRMVFLGLATSMTGDSLMVLVFAVWAKSLTGSNATAGLVMLCIAAPYLLVPFGSWLIDRFPRKPFLIVANVSSAVALSPLALVHGRGDVWLIYVVASLYGISAIVISAALNGLFKDVVPDSQLADANAVTQTVKQGLRLGGPLVGTLLYAAAGGAVVAAVDGASFLVAALFISRIANTERPTLPEAGHRIREMTAGLRHLVGQPVLRRIMIAGAQAMLVIGLIESVMFAVIQQGLHRPPQFIGVISVAQGAGSILGGLIAARLVNRLGELSTSAVGLFAFGLGSGLSIVAAVPGVLAGFCVLGFGIPVLIVGMTTAVQRLTPAPLIGRASAAFDMVLSGPQTVAIGLGAALVSRVDYRILLLVIVAGTWSGAVLMWTGRRSTTPTPPVPLEPPAASAEGITDGGREAADGGVGVDVLDRQ